MTYSIPQIMMTLSAIAYVDDTSKDSATIGCDITSQLSNPHYATTGKWALAWGPVIGAGHDNLAYVARCGDTMAVVLRGTTTDPWSIIEDIPTGQTQFPGAPAGATVSLEFLNDGLNELLAAPAPDGTTLVTFLQKTRPSALFVTGHSQGGGLTPMMMAALQIALSRKIEAHAFAPPTSGNPQFANWISSMCSCTFHINPLDIVPLGYAAIGDIVSKGIPLDIPPTEQGLAVAAATELVAVAAEEVGPWMQPLKSQNILPRVPIYPILLGNPGFWDVFKAAAGAQHAHNNYLSLLKAPQVTL